MIRPILRMSVPQFRANLAAVTARISPSELMLVVKDDAYGHGLGWVIEEAAEHGIRWFGSYDLATARTIRRSLPGDHRIFAWATSTDDEIDDALNLRIDFGVGSAEYLRRIVARAHVLNSRARVHLKIDTGLHRNGILPGDWSAAIAEACEAEADGAIEFVGVWSHLAEASDELDDDAHEVFVSAVSAATAAAGKPLMTHLTASAASWWRPELRGTASRIGAFGYGVRSAEGPEPDGIAPIASLTAAVQSITDDEAVIAIGSADGFPSTLAGVQVGTPAGARKLVSVDLTTSTVAGWAGMAVGQEVVLFGPGLHGESSATTLAETIGTVGEEILTRLVKRVKRVVNE